MLSKDKVDFMVSSCVLIMESFRACTLYIDLLLKYFVIVLFI